jgi:hypothetical protein
MQQASEVGGLIKYLGLVEWWLGTFSDQERAVILDRVAKPFSAYADMQSGNVTYTSFTPAMFVCGLTGWFTRRDLRTIGRKIAISAEERLADIDSLVDQHFALTDLIDFWQRAGDHSSDDINRELALCRRQTAIADKVAPLLKAKFNDNSLPVHIGLTHLLRLLDPAADGAEIATLKEWAARTGWRINR